MRKLSLFLFVLAFAGAASAHAAHFEEPSNISYNETQVSEILGEPDTVVSAYNQNVDQLPSLAKSLVSGERINGRVETPQGEKVIGVAMDGAKIETVKMGGVENPTVEFHTDASTLETIIKAENPREEAISAFNGPQITYTAHSLGSTVKFAVLSTISKVLGFLS